jgi:stringent starvation protein B
MADTPPRPLPPKKEIALALLEGESVFIRLDPRKEGVSVPKNLAKQPQLILQIGLNLAVRIPDLTIDEEGVSCTLRFNRAPFWCRIPWAAIYALAGPDGRGMLWPDDVPPEVAEQMRSGRASAKDAAQGKDDPPEGASRNGSKPAAKTASRRPRARPVESDAAEAEGAPPSAPRVPTRPVLAAVPSPPRSPVDPPRVGDPRFGDRFGDRSSAGRGGPPSRGDAPLGAHDRSRAGGAPRRPGGSPPAGGSPAGGSQGGAKKAKRELPPYLRVVK